MYRRMHVLYLLLVSGLLVSLLAACGSEPENRATATPSPAPPTASPTPSAELRQLQMRYERLQAAHRAIAAVWEGLASGEQVQCGNYPDYPAPESITTGATDDQAELAELLQSAAIAIDEAVTLWRAECDHTRPTTPPDVIDRGRLAARTAGDILHDIETLLSARGLLQSTG